MEELLTSIPSEIISALISGGVAWAVSRYETKKEFEKLKLTWEHDKSKSFNESFEAMAYSVTQFSKLGNDTTWREALSHISTVRATCPDDLTYSLDGLYNVVSRRQMKGSEVALSKAIAAKRIYDRSQLESQSKAAD